jgi:hypothetical protein
MNREEHHAKADQLLEQARDAYDPVSRSQILAEAHVHAILAPSAGRPVPTLPRRDKPPAKPRQRINLAPFRGPR